MMTTHRVVLAPGPPGVWRMFIALPGSVSDWPTEEFIGGAIPTPDARVAVLQEWGYEIVPGHEWDWHEDVEDDGSVFLLAGTEVRRG